LSFWLTFAACREHIFCSASEALRRFTVPLCPHATTDNMNMTTIAYFYFWTGTGKRQTAGDWQGKLQDLFRQANVELSNMGMRIGSATRSQ
jgi:hypothetical protein